MINVNRDNIALNAQSMPIASVRFSRLFAAPLLAVLAMTTSSFALVAPQEAEVAAAPAPVDPEQVGMIAAALQADLSKLAPTASVEDMEASMMFVLGQGEYSLETMEAALDVMEAGPNVTPTLKKAIANVRLALRRKFRRGTAAIPGGAGDGGGSGFSAPVIAIGGGGANYGN